MIGTIARKEFVMLRRDARVRLTAVVLVVMVAVAFLSATSRYKDISQEQIGRAHV